MDLLEMPDLMAYVSLITTEPSSDLCDRAKQLPLSLIVPSKCPVLRKNLNEEDKFNEPYVYLALESNIPCFVKLRATLGKQNTFSSKFMSELNSKGGDH
jgi:hypothetical protein